MSPPVTDTRYRLFPAPTALGVIPRALSQTNRCGAFVSSCGSLSQPLLIACSRSNMLLLIVLKTAQRFRSACAFSLCVTSLPLAFISFHLFSSLLADCVVGVVGVVGVCSGL